MASTEFHNHDPDPAQDPLWHRIEAFDFNALDETLPFAQRLARENGWTPDYAARVVEEYKRFCYLAICAGHAVVPPDQIDQARTIGKFSARRCCAPTFIIVRFHTATSKRPTVIAKPTLPR